MRACGKEIKIREHFLRHCPRHAVPWQASSSCLKRTTARVTLLLSDPLALKTPLCYLASSIRFDTLYCLPSDNSQPGKPVSDTTTNPATNRLPLGKPISTVVNITEALAKL